MNDGVVLPADIFRPVDDKRHPVIVVPVRLVKLATSGRSRISRRGCPHPPLACQRLKQSLGSEPPGLAEAAAMPVRTFIGGAQSVLPLQSGSSNYSRAPNIKNTVPVRTQRPITLAGPSSPPRRRGKNVVMRPNGFD